MKILIVGAGAVGQVYGHYLYRGGAQVSFLVRPKYEQQVTSGFCLHPLRRTSIGREEHFTQYEVFTTAASALSEPWDQVWFCVSSDGLMESSNQELLENIGPVSVVMLQPDLLDRRWILQWIKEEQLVQGLISFLSYQTPLPGEEAPPAGDVAYLLFPKMYSFFSGAEERVISVVESLNRGGMPAKVRQDLPWVSAERSAIAIPLVAGLEIEGWSVSQFRRSSSNQLACRAARQALAVAARFHRHRKPLKAQLVRPLMSATFLSAAKMYSAFDLEAYLAFHFSKVGKQTRLMLQNYIELGEDEDLSVNGLRYLKSKLEQADLSSEALGESL